MSVLQPSQQVARARYATMEKGAGATLAALACADVACLVLLQPGLLLTFGSLLAGIAAFICWRTVLSGKHATGVVSAIAAVLLFLFAAAAEFTRPLPILLAVGLSYFGTGLYAPILLQRLKSERSEHEV